MPREAGDALNEILAVATLSAAIYVVAGLAQAVTGFGMSLAAVPLLSLVVDTRSAVVAAVAVSVVVTGTVGWREREYADTVVARRLSVSGLFGLPVGLVALGVLPEHWLILLVAGVVLVLVAAIALGVRLPTGIGSQRFAGVLSGALLTSTSMNGPPLVLALGGGTLGPREFRATLQMVFGLQGALGLLGFAALGQVDRVAILVAVGGCCGVPLGWWLGDRLFHRLSPGTFRRVVLGGLVVTALVALGDAT